MDPTRPTIINALSVDVEEYYHATIFQQATKGSPIHDHESRVEASVDRLLNLLRTRDTKATFFVLGEVAAAHPALIKRIATEGHETASHGYHHNLVSQLTPQEFRDDVSQAKRILEDVTGKPVVGYRAPSFSIGSGQHWAYDILLEQGFQYDSSIYPILHDRYGNPTAPRFPYLIRRNGHRHLIEFPVGTARLLGVNLPIGGGGYFRILPFAFIRWGIHRVNTHENEPVLFYLHPWELDNDQPRPPMAWNHRFRHYVGIRGTEAKLSCLLRHVRFTSIRNILDLS